MSKVDSIEAALDARRQIESEIRAIVSMYESQFGLIVDGITIVRSYTVGGKEHGTIEATSVGVRL